MEDITGKICKRPRWDRFTDYLLIALIILTVIAFIFAVYLVLDRIFLNPPAPIEDRCTNQCNEIGYEYFKWDQGGFFSKSTCWCIQPNKEPINIGEV